MNSLSDNAAFSRQQQRYDDQEPQEVHDEQQDDEPPLWKILKWEEENRTHHGE